MDAAFDDVLWDACLEKKLGPAGLRPDQVRVIYHKAANQFTTGPGGAALPPYPDPMADYFAFRRNLSSFAARVRVEFPAVQAVYTSSRSYGGFTNNPGRGEPLSYEEGHALNGWFAENSPVGGVWYGWGPYLWAPECGSGVTNAEGTCYVREDYVSDGVHPSDSGRAKVARLIHERLNLHQQGATSFLCDEHRGPRHALGRLRGAAQLGLREKERRRIGHRLEAAVGHRKDTQLIDGAKPILHRPNHSKGRLRIAFEVEHRIDHVLEHSGACEGALLRDMADQEEAAARLFGPARELCSAFAHL